MGHDEHSPSGNSSAATRNAAWLRSPCLALHGTKPVRPARGLAILCRFGLRLALARSFRDFGDFSIFAGVIGGITMQTAPSLEK